MITAVVWSLQYPFFFSLQNSADVRVQQHLEGVNYSCTAVLVTPTRTIYIISSNAQKIKASNKSSRFLWTSKHFGCPLRIRNDGINVQRWLR